MTNGVGKEPLIRSHKYFCQQSNLFCKTCHLFLPFVFAKVVAWQGYCTCGEQFVKCLFLQLSLHCLELLPFQSSCSSVCVLAVTLPFAMFWGTKLLCFCIKFWGGNICGYLGSIGLGTCSAFRLQALVCYYMGVAKRKINAFLSISFLHNLFLLCLSPNRSSSLFYSSR